MRNRIAPSAPLKPCRRRRGTARLFVLGAAFLASTGARSGFAQQQPEADKPPKVEEFVAVTAEAPRPAPSSPNHTEPLRDTPQTIVIIPQGVLREQGATSLRDALRNTPGIALTAGEGGTAPGDNLLIRGFSARNDVYRRAGLSNGSGR